MITQEDELANIDSIIYVKVYQRIKFSIITETNYQIYYDSYQIIKGYQGRKTLNKNIIRV